MRYVAAYLLAAMGGGDKQPSSADIEKILESVGIEAEADKIKKVISELNGKNLDDVIAEGELNCEVKTTLDFSNSLSNGSSLWGRYLVINKLQSTIPK